MVWRELDLPGDGRNNAARSLGGLRKNRVECVRFDGLHSCPNRMKRSQDTQRVLSARPQRVETRCVSWEMRGRPERDGMVLGYSSVACLITSPGVVGRL